MKIHYVGYLDPYAHHGGGEMVARQLIDAGRARGHTFTFSTVRPHRRGTARDADLHLVVDAFNYPATLRSLGAWRRFPAALLEEVAASGRFVHYTNAYADVCNLPYLPCSGDAQPACPYKAATRVRRNLALRDFGGACFASNALVRRLYSAALLNVFVSPLHQRITYRVLGLGGKTPHYVLKPAIDGSRFYDRGMTRDIDYLFVGIIGEAKGLAEMRRRFRDADIHFAGRIAPGEKLDFGTYHGHVPYERVPELMNRARHFVFLPRWPEPQGRVVVEAALCGCTLVTNDRVGATSFPFDLRRVENFARADEEFWERIEALQ